MTDRVKYPRTPHLPWSAGRSADDVGLADPDAAFGGREVVVTEKADGENTTIYADGFTHARSRDSGAHPSRERVRALAAAVGAAGLPPGLRLCGENVAARHSLAYDRLPGWFLVFSVWEGDRCLSWDATREWCALLDLPTVPVRYRGPWDPAALRAAWDGRSALGAEAEGYVVRAADAFDAADFGRRVAKFVRAGHVGTGPHWMLAPVVPNTLAGGAKR